MYLFATHITLIEEKHLTFQFQVSTVMRLLYEFNIYEQYNLFMKINVKIVGIGNCSISNP